jgi:hypothetical protein
MNSNSQPTEFGRGIRKVDVLVEKFGGRPKGWTKKKTWDESGQEWHYYEHDGIGRVGVKPAGEPDPF